MAIEFRCERPLSRRGARAAVMATAAHAGKGRPELVFELLDGTGERRLCHIALLRSLGEIQLADRRQEISDLMHFHGSSLPPHC